MNIINNNNIANTRRTAYLVDLMEIPLAASTITMLCKGMRILVYYVHVDEDEVPDSDFGEDDVESHEENDEDDEKTKKKTVAYEGEVVAVKRAFAVSSTGKACDIEDVILVATIQYEGETEEEEELKFSDFISASEMDSAPEDAWRFVGDDNINMLIQNMIIDRAASVTDAVAAVPCALRPHHRGRFKALATFVVMVGAFAVFAMVVMARANTICAKVCPRDAPLAASKACDHLLGVAEAAKSWWKTTSAMLETAFNKTGQIPARNDDEPSMI